MMAGKEEEETRQLFSIVGIPITKGIGENTLSLILLLFSRFSLVDVHATKSSMGRLSIMLVLLLLLAVLLMPPLL